MSNVGRSATGTRRMWGAQWRGGVWRVGRALQVEGAVQAEAVRWEHAGPRGEQVAWAGPGRRTVGDDAGRKVWGLNCQAGSLAKENLAVREGK